MTRTEMAQQLRDLMAGKLTRVDCPSYVVQPAPSGPTDFIVFPKCPSGHSVYYISMENIPVGLTLTPYVDFVVDLLDNPDLFDAMVSAYGCCLRWKDRARAGSPRSP